MDNNFNSPINNQPYPEQSPTPPSPVTSSKKSSSGKSKRILGILAVILLVLASFGAGYYIQSLNTKTVQDELNSANKRIETLEKQSSSNSDNEKSSEKTDQDTVKLIPGFISQDDNGVTLEAKYLESLKPTAVWIEFGTSPNELNKSTAKFTSELTTGEVDNNVFSPGIEFTIKSSDLTPDTSYYYKVVVTSGDSNISSAPASFTRN